MRLAHTEWTSINYFTLAAICWTGGILNSYKLPETLHNHGNVAALVPHLLIISLIIGPLLFSEIALGQHTKDGVFGIWKMAPVWCGTGFASMFVLLCITLQTHYLTSISLYYMIRSVGVRLAWSTCRPSWENCYNLTSVTEVVEDCCPNICNVTKMLNSVEYFYENVLLKQNTFGNFQSINWPLIICSGLLLFIVFTCFSRALNSIEKCLNFLILIPMLLLILLSLTSLSYQCSIKSLKHFFIPKFCLLKNINIWVDIFNINILNFGLGLGGLIVIGSLSKFHTNIYTVSIITPIFNLLLNLIFSIFVYSSFVGYARVKNIDVEPLFHYNQQLLFVKIPIILLEWPVSPQLWNFIFFAYLFCIGLRASIFMILTLARSVNEKFISTKSYPKSSFAAVCLLIFFLSLIYFTHIGIKIFNNFENHLSNSLVNLILFLQLIGIFYVYSVNRFYKDTYFMLNYKCLLLKGLWYILPIISLLTLIYNLYDFFTKSKDLTVRTFTLDVMILIFPILIWAIYLIKYWIEKRDYDLRFIFGPHKSWNIDKDSRKNRESFTNEMVSKENDYRQNLYSRKIDENM